MGLASLKSGGHFTPFNSQLAEYARALEVANTILSPRSAERWADSGRTVAHRKYSPIDRGEIYSLASLQVVAAKIRSCVGGDSG